MRQWQTLLAGLVLWTVHFFALYIIASLFPGSRMARLSILAVTVVMLTVTLLLARKVLLRSRQHSDGVDKWVEGLSVLGYALAGLAMVYQALPAVLI